MATKKNINIGGVFQSITGDKKIVITDNIFDDNENQFQADLNRSFKNKLSQHDSGINNAVESASQARASSENSAISAAKSAQSATRAAYDADRAEGYVSAVKDTLEQIAEGGSIPENTVAKVALNSGKIAELTKEIFDIDEDEHQYIENTLPEADWNGYFGGNPIYDTQQNLPIGAKLTKLKLASDGNAKTDQQTRLMIYNADGTGDPIADYPLGFIGSSYTEIDLRPLDITVEEGKIYCVRTVAQKWDSNLTGRYKAVTSGGLTAWEKTWAGFAFDCEVGGDSVKTIENPLPEADWSGYFGGAAICDTQQNLPIGAKLTKLRLASDGNAKTDARTRLMIYNSDGTQLLAEHYLGYIGENTTEFDLRPLDITVEDGKIYCVRVAAQKYSSTLFGRYKTVTASGLTASDKTWYGFAFDCEIGVNNVTQTIENPIPEAAWSGYFTGSAIYDTQQNLPVGAKLTKLKCASYNNTQATQRTRLMIYNSDGTELITEHYLDFIGTSETEFDLRPLDITVEEGKLYCVRVLATKWDSNLTGRYQSINASGLAAYEKTWCGFAFDCEIAGEEAPEPVKTSKLLRFDEDIETLKTGVSSLKSQKQDKLTPSTVLGKINGNDFHFGDSVYVAGGEGSGGSGNVNPELDKMFRSRLSDYTIASHWIDGSVWKSKTSLYSAYIIPIKGNAEIVATANEINNTRIAFANTYDAGSIVSGTTVIDGIGNQGISAGKTGTFVAPSSARFLVLSATYGGKSSVPVKLSINGVSYLTEWEDRYNAIDQVPSLVDAVTSMRGIVGRNITKDCAVRGCGVKASSAIKPLAFVHVSDIHTRATDYLCFKNACQFLEHYPNISFGIATGDLVYDTFQDPMTYYNDAIKETSKPFLNVIGNHDVGQYRSGRELSVVGTDAQVYAKYIQPYEGIWGVNTTGKSYYYKDFSEEKIRLIVLDEFEFTETITTSNAQYREYRAMTQTQVDWFISTLSNTPNDFGVIVAYHQPDRFGYDDNPFVSDSLQGAKTNNIVSSNADWLPSIIEAFRTHTSINFSFSQNEAVKGTINVNANFSGKTSEFICILNGHTHNDYVGHLAAFPNLLTLCVGADNLTYTGANCQRAKGTPSEDMFNVVNVDRNRKQITIIRIGADASITGQDRRMMTIKYA